MATKKETTTNNPARQTIEMMVLRPGRIQSEDISSWVNAVNNAKAGRRTMLYNLYENVMADTILADAIDKRVNAITNAEIAFLKDGKSVEDMEDIIDTPEFEELIREIILAKAWGKSVIDVSFNPEFKIFSVPRKHIRIDKMDRPLKERKRYILARENDITGYDYEKDPYIIECGKDDDLGFIFRAAPYVIYKRGGFGDWAQFAEIFGMPFLIGKYNGHDPQAKERLFEALSSIGSNPRAAMPKESELEVIANNSSGSNTLYKDFKDACNQEILIAVLGNLMTTLDGSSRSQSEVHQETQQEIAKSDRRYVQRILNRKLLPLLIKRGYPVAGGFFSFPDQGESITTKERLDMALRVKKEGIPVDDDYIYEITGIPKAQKQPDKEPDPAKPKDPDDPKPADKDPKPESQKKKGLRDFFALAPATGSGANREDIWTSLRRFITGKVELSDDYSINISKLFQEALNEIYGGDAPLVNPRLFEITNGAIQQAFKVEFGKEGADWGKGNAGFIDEFRNNGAVFAAFKNHQQTKDLIALLTDESGNTRSFSQFKKLALQVSEKYNVNWLKTEYNTAVRSARSAINFRKYLENEHIYPNLEYMESMASHKREKHLAYVGTVLPIRHEWWGTHMPPSDWNCQCWVRPTRKAVTAVPPGELVPPVFSNNPGSSAKFIKTEETPYYKNTDEAIRETIESIAMRLERLRQRVEENAKLFEKLKADKDYLDVKLSKKTGGLKATHILHQFNKLTGEHEKQARDILFSNGHSIILGKELAAKGEKVIDGMRYVDGTLNGSPADISTILGKGKNTIKHALNHIRGKGAETAILFFPEGSIFNMHRLVKGIKMYEGQTNYRFENLVFIAGGKVYYHK